MYRLFLILIFLCIIQTQDKTIYHIQYDGAIGPVSLEIFKHAIETAEVNNAQCLIVEMDTPGGLMKSMNMMIKDILASEVPVVIYVSPSGSHCGSAGVFLMMAAHINAMAPGSNIGAAHPVTMGGANDSTQSVMMEKVTNDAVSYIRSLAEKNGRNPDWAEDAVRESVSITERQALDSNVIDLIAVNMDSLIAALDGREVETIIGKKTLDTENAKIVTLDRSWKMDFLGMLADPNIAYILMMIGMYGIFFELYNPGAIAPGVIGAICLILAFFAFQSIPVSYTGMLLILLGAILFIMEIKITSYGLLSIAGSISLILGSIFLIDSTDEIMQISYTVMIPIMIITIAFFTFILMYGIKAQRNRIASGTPNLEGKMARVMEKMVANKHGKVYVNGEIWQAICEEEIKKDEMVIVKAVDNLILRVEKQS